MHGGRGEVKPKGCQAEGIRLCPGLGDAHQFSSQRIANQRVPNEQEGRLPAHSPFVPDGLTTHPENTGILSKDKRTEENGEKEIVEDRRSEQHLQVPRTEQGHRSKPGEKHAGLPGAGAKAPELCEVGAGPRCVFFGGSCVYLLE
jgi:hypothetical protein